jgi:hypothetical protein
MALTNNEKQIRHKKIEALRNFGNQVLIRRVFTNTGFNPLIEKSNEEIKEEIEAIVNLPSGWTDEDYEVAVRKLNNILNISYDNPHLMNNDINGAYGIMDSDFNLDELRKAEYKAPEVVRNIKSILKLSELNKSNQIAVVAEVMRQLAKEILDEKKIPKTFANATALSLIGHQYDKPDWTWELLAHNLYIQNSKEKTDIIAAELTSPDLGSKGGLACMPI